METDGLGQSGRRRRLPSTSSRARIFFSFLFFVWVVLVVLVVKAFAFLSLAGFVVVSGSLCRRRRVIMSDIGLALDVLHQIQGELPRLDQQHSSSEPPPGRWLYGVQELRRMAERIWTEHESCNRLIFCKNCYSLRKQATKLVREGNHLAVEGKDLLRGAVRQNRKLGDVEPLLSRIVLPSGLQGMAFLEMEVLKFIWEYPVFPFHGRSSCRRRRVLENNLLHALNRLQEIQEDLREITEDLVEQWREWNVKVQHLRFEAERIMIEHDACGMILLCSTKCYSLGTEASNLLDTATSLAIQGKVLVLKVRAAGRRWQVRDVAGCWQNPPLHKMASYEKEVLGFLERQTFGASSLLGIWGVPGVGKTTLLRFVRDSSFPFDHIFFVGAGIECGKIQHVLSMKIGRPPPHMSDVPLAEIISSCLERKSFLLLLDDVRERLDLAALGLPMPLRHNQKVIFTTRNPAVCTQMGCTTVHMEVLLDVDGDPWSLFKNQIGDEIIDSHSHIERFAKKMMPRCNGLPSALCTLGRAMSTKRDVREWRYAYDVIKRKLPPVNLIQGMDDEGYSRLHHLEYALQDSFL